jgi:ATP-binding cassette subfamily F protein 3
VLKRGECAAVIGPNGAGKTTLLKTLLGQIPPLEGEVVLGASLNIGYFAQAHEGLSPERTLVEEINAVAPHLLLAEVRDYLARFLFTGDDVFKKVEVISGGERGRLALAKLSITQTNLLLLDEPTNHLDIPSQEVLQEVLADYQGTVLLVSHDRYLIDALGTQIWEILPDQASMQVFTGTYTEYKIFQELKQIERLAKTESRREPIQSRRERPPSTTIQERRRQARIHELERLITLLEDQLKELSHRLENPPTDPGKVNKLGQDYVRIQDELERLMAEWEGLHILEESP